MTLSDFELALCSFLIDCRSAGVDGLVSTGCAVTRVMPPPGVWSPAVFVSPLVVDLFQQSTLGRIFFRFCLYSLAGSLLDFLSWLNLDTEGLAYRVVSGGSTGSTVMRFWDILLFVDVKLV